MSRLGRFGMNRMATVAAAVLGGLAMLGVGVAVGTSVGREETLAASAAAQGPLTAKDGMVLQEFSAASTEFDRLMGKAKKGKAVGPAMIKQADAMLAVRRAAQGQALKDVADATAQAMLLLGAGLSANDGATVEEGIKAYKTAQEKVTQLAKEVAAAKGETGAAQQSTPASPSGQPQ